MAAVKHPGRRGLTGLLVAATSSLLSCAPGTDGGTTAGSAGRSAGTAPVASDAGAAGSTSAPTTRVPGSSPRAGTTVVPIPAGVDVVTQPPPPATHANLAYATSSPAEVLDLWLPPAASAAEPAPLVIFVHGGAFRSGDKAMVGSKVVALNAAGFAVATVNYRLSQEALFPAGVQDVAAAVRWLRTNASTYAVDPDAFVLWGESAGATIAMLVGATGGSAVFTDRALGNPDVSSAVRAVVDWYGPTDFAAMDRQAVQGSDCAEPLTHDGLDSPESQWVGGAVPDSLEVVAQASPITYLMDATTLPAFSIAHGDADCNVPYRQSEVLADALTALGQSPTYTLLDGATHADPRFDRVLLDPTISWLEHILQR